MFPCDVLQLHSGAGAVDRREETEVFNSWAGMGTRTGLSSIYRHHDRGDVYVRTTFVCS